MFRLVFFSALVLAAAGHASSDRDRVAQVFAERQPIPDQGTGSFRNPILAGHYHDPTIVRVGEDYYMTHCPDFLLA